jgi:hypothetical protein
MTPNPHLLLYPGQTSFSDMCWLAPSGIPYPTGVLLDSVKSTASICLNEES